MPTTRSQSLPSGLGSSSGAWVNVGVLDPETFKQLTTRKSEWSENRKLRVESKDKMRAEGRHSPDRGDALLGCIVCGNGLSRRSPRVKWTRRRWDARRSRDRRWG